MKRHYVFATCLCLFFVGNALAASSSDGVWRNIDKQTAYLAAKRTQTPWIQPDKFQLFSLNTENLEGILQQAPLEHIAQKTAQTVPKYLTIPAPDGSYAKFEIVASSIMEPELAAKHPDIKTYSGRLVTDPAVVVRFDWTPDGFHAQVIDHGQLWYVDPYYKGESYASYRKSDYHPTGKEFNCLADGYHSTANRSLLKTSAKSSSGNILRTFRIAVACTGEYAQFHGGTKDAAFSAIVTTINRVTGIYEYELAVRLTLVAKNDAILFTNPETDPFSNDDSDALIDESQTVINNAIGAANYDIGHTVSTGGGGLAGFGVVCVDSYKALGITGSSSPIGDAYDVDYVAHEIGHQFGADHTFNGQGGSCDGNRAASVAYEPGSGSTIMAYAGICGADNLQNHSDALFHSASFDEILDNLINGSGTCGKSTALGNAIPIVNAGNDYTIPINTPFALSGSATDADGDTLNYLWEERDLGPQATLDAADDGAIPLFRVYTPTSSGTRYFPQLQTVVNNTIDNAEKLPQLARTMDFRLTARDGKGGVNSDEMQVTVADNSGPFRVTSNISGTFNGGDAIHVTWDAAGTNIAPVSTANVAIYLSTDGGLTWTKTLAASTPNDGSQTVTLPSDVSTSTARIIVKAVNNIFFDISDSDFALIATQNNSSGTLAPILKLLL